LNVLRNVIKVTSTAIARKLSCTFAIQRTTILLLRLFLSWFENQLKIALQLSSKGMDCIWNDSLLEKVTFTILSIVKVGGGN
jgi:hypothetical protein